MEIGVTHAGGKVMDNIISVDIETSSSTLEGKLLSIGMVKLSTKEEIYREAKFRKGLFITPESMMVNGITHQQLDDKSLPTLDEMDKELAKWVDGGSIMMGRGVSYFDRKFIERDLPHTWNRFGRRVFDLTGLVFGLSVRTKRSFHDIRRDALNYASEKTDEVFKDRQTGVSKYDRHHALWDAWSNIYALEYLTRRVKK